MTKKYGFIIVLLLITGLLNAQDSLLYNIFPMAGGTISYTRIIDAPALSQEQIIKKSQSFLVSYKNNGKNLTQDDSGNLLSSGSVSEMLALPPLSGRDSLRIPLTYSYHIKVQTKAGKSKMTIDNLTLSGSQNDIAYDVKDYESLNKGIYSNFNKRYMAKYYTALHKSYAKANIQLQSLLDAFASYLTKKEDF